MGDTARPVKNDGPGGKFTRALIRDVHALERMLATPGLFETGNRRIGAEQEMFLVDPSMRPAPVALEVMKQIDDPRLTTELAKFNLEANASPRVLGGTCLSELHCELDELLSVVREGARSCDAEVVLAGILPTLRQQDLSLDNMTPLPRYRELNDAIVAARGDDFQVTIKGTDELQLTHSNVMLEACNTSFQVHFQVAPDEFARLYNVAQVVTAPVLAAAVNSPLLLGHRLWGETRVALFLWAVDSRSAALQARSARPRVSFGDAWVRESVLEIFQEQISRFRAVLRTDDVEDPMEVLEAGGVPTLPALRYHNGTVYRWNRACYGISDGKPHLRIENRVLPAGPTVLDEVANASFFFGLMSGMLGEHTDITTEIGFDDAKANFLAAARQGLKAQFSWIGGETKTAAEVIANHLLPLAREGLLSSKVDEADADRYLDVIAARVREKKTGAFWLVRSLAEMDESASQDMRERTLTAKMLEHQQVGNPVHEWPLCEASGAHDWRESYRTVGRLMSTDLFTVQADDVLDLAASVMDWERLRYIPVEDDQGRLQGILSHRTLLRALLRRDEAGTEIAVRDIMKTELFTATPETSTLEAMHMMQRHRVGALPVVERERLVGIITMGDLIRLSTTLLERYLRDED
ncbi:MAG: CBS domain-containing protein [Myxococcota bacterium]